MSTLSQLEDKALLASLHALVRSHRRVTSDIVAHLGEMDERRLHLTRGFSSLFDYCLKELRFSEDEAYRRIEVARLARRFPAVLTTLQEGKASLSALALLKPHLNDDNCASLLAVVSDVSVKIAKERLAARFPLAQVQDGVRKLPAPEAKGLAPAELPAKAKPIGMASPVDVPTTQAKLGGEQHVVPSGHTPSPRPTVEPVGLDRFLVKITVTRSVRDKLELARDLMRHLQPDGRMEAILEAALDALLAKLEREKFGRAKHPRSESQSNERRESRDAKRAPRVLGRNVPRSSKREAVARDGMRCAFVSEDGRRCEARAFLEFDHVTPAGKGGGPEASNIRVLCRAHNRLMAERAYGRKHVEAAITAKQEARARQEAPPAIDEHGKRSRSSPDPRHRG